MRIDIEGLWMDGEDEREREGRGRELIDNRRGIKYNLKNKTTWPLLIVSSHNSGKCFLTIECRC